MATRNSTVTELQDQVLESIRTGQQVVIDAMKSWTEAVGEYVGKTPSWPGMEQTPTATEVVDKVFDFAGELLNAQRQFVHGVLAITPVAEQTKEQDAKPARTTK